MERIKIGWICLAPNKDR